MRSFILAEYVELKHTAIHSTLCAFDVEGYDFVAKLLPFAKCPQMSFSPHRSSFQRRQEGSDHPS